MPLSAVALPDMSFFLIAGTVVLIGATVQSSIGLGLGLIAAPVISFLEPSLMPGAILMATAVLPLLSLLAEWRHVDWRGLAWGIPGRIPGSLTGAWIVAVLDPKMLGAVVGSMVLVAVGLSLLSVRVPITPVSLLSAGAASGVTGTATSIGGPPLALLYQNESGPRVRATLAAFFLFGVGISLTVLTVTGQMGQREAWTGAVLVPCVIAGFLAGRPVRRVVDAGILRAALLAVVATSGAVLVMQSLS